VPRPTVTRTSLVAVLVAALVVFLRFPDALVHPQLFAEGGYVFFAGAYTDGLSSVLKPYAGYLHFVPRLVALGAMEIDPKWTPAIYNVFAFLVEVPLPPGAE